MKGEWKGDGNDSIRRPSTGTFVKLEVDP